MEDTWGIHDRHMGGHTGLTELATTRGVYEGKIWALFEGED